MTIHIIKKIPYVSNELRDTCYRITDACGGDAERIRRYIKGDINIRHESLFVYENDWRVCGFIKGCFDYDNSPIEKMGKLTQAWVDWLYVDPKFHRIGIGTHLLSAYMNQAIHRGAPKILLTSSPTAQALSFYKKHHFERIEMCYDMVKTL